MKFKVQIILKLGRSRMVERSRIRRCRAGGGMSDWAVRHVWDRRREDTTDWR